MFYVSSLFKEPQLDSEDKGSGRISVITYLRFLGTGASWLVLLVVLILFITAQVYTNQMVHTVLVCSLCLCYLRELQWLQIGGFPTGELAVVLVNMYR